ncbi:hypothetical protein ACNKHS_22825 [Shigella flexneri]
MDSIISHQPLEYNRIPNKLEALARFNGLDLRTRLFLSRQRGGRFSQVGRRWWRMSLHHFPLRLPAPTPKRSTAR